MDFNPNLEKDIKWERGWKDLPQAYVKIKVPGVSSVINDMVPNPEIDKWIEEVGKEKADEITKNAHDRGTSMHCFIENFLTKMQEGLDPGAALRFTQEESPQILTAEKIPQHKINEGRDLFYDFYDSQYATDYEEILGTESKLYSPKLFYRGIMDWFYKKRLYGLSVSDFKTSSKPIEAGSRKEEGYKLQLGGYSLAMDHMIEEKNGPNSQRINFASIISIHTKSNLVQSIELHGEELQSYKDKFETIVKEYHIKHGQKFLID